MLITYLYCLYIIELQLIVKSRSPLRRKTGLLRPAVRIRLRECCCDAIFFRFPGDFLVCAVPVARASVRTNGGRRHRGCWPTCRGVRGPLAATVLSLMRKMTCAALRTGHCVTFTAGRLRICARDTVKGICVVITVEAPEARTNWNVVPASYVPAGSMA